MKVGFAVKINAILFPHKVKKSGFCAVCFFFKIV